MRAEITNLSLATVPPEARLMHGTDVLYFSVSYFGRKALEKYDIFHQINNYWASLPEKDQAYIFSLYKDITTIFESRWEQAALAIHLNQKIVALLDFHDYDTVFQWVLFKSDMAVPIIFDKEYIDSVDRQGTREQTYTRSDYTRLVTLSLILRTMVPIWGRYIELTRKNKGTDWKEFYAFQLINRSQLLSCPGFVKLRVYIDGNIRSMEMNPSKIVCTGVSTEDFAGWLLAIVTVRGLCVGDIRGIETKSHIVSYLFQYIRQKTHGTDGPADETIKSKVHDTKDDSGLTTKLSVLECYKIKNRIAVGEIVELEYSLKDMHRCAYRLTANMDSELLERCLYSSAVLINYPLLDPQITLLRWIFKPLISPKGLLYLSKEQLTKAIGVAQAVLWVRGHHYLSLLISSYANATDEFYVFTTDGKVRISKELLSEISTLYPYTKLIGGKKFGQKPVNLAVLSIDTLTEQLSASAWMATADEGFLSEVLDQPNLRRIPIVPDLRLHLAKLVVELGARSWI